jgi:hypothetical protein
MPPRVASHSTVAHFAVRARQGLAALAIVLAILSAWPGGTSGQDRSRAEPPSRVDPPNPAYPLRFDSEVIRLRIVGDSLEVDGTYVLVCQRPYGQAIPLFYPFPADSLLAGARMIEGRVRIDGGSWEPLRFDAIPRATGVRWWAPPCAGGMIEIQGRYRQGLMQNYARYIVTTTRGWPDPLRRARFEIRLPEGAIPFEFSFPFRAERDSSNVPGPPGAADSSRVVYVWETESFYPDRDITVRWR